MMRAVGCLVLALAMGTLTLLVIEAARAFHRDAKARLARDEARR